jgi:hypothetical protein
LESGVRGSNSGFEFRFSGFGFRSEEAKGGGIQEDLCRCGQLYTKHDFSVGWRGRAGEGGLQECGRASLKVPDLGRSQVWEWNMAV